MNIPLKNPEPDVTELKNIILRKKMPSRVHVAEFRIDTEFIKEVTENMLGRKWADASSDNRKAQEEYLYNNIEFWYHLGFDSIRFSSVGYPVLGRHEHLSYFNGRVGISMPSVLLFLFCFRQQSF